MTPKSTKPATACDGNGLYFTGVSGETQRKNTNYAAHSQPTPEHCRKLLQYIPQRPDYKTWIECIAAVGNTFSEITALDLLRSRFTDERKNEHAHKLRLRLKDVNFGTLVRLAKLNGYNGNGNAVYYAAPTPQPKPEPLIFTDTDTDTMLHNADGERVFRLAVNRMVVNKTGNNTALTHGYMNEELTLSQIAKVIRQGHALCASQMVEKADGSIHRLSSNFLRSELIFLDLDFSKNKKIDMDTYIPLELFLESDFAAACAMIYESVSSTPEWNRYRLIIPLPYLDTNAARYQKTLKTFIAEYNADAACSDICRAYYGNTNATIFNLVSGEVLK